MICIITHIFSASNYIRTLTKQTQMITTECRCTNSHHICFIHKKFKYSLNTKLPHQQACWVWRQPFHWNTGKHSNVCLHRYPSKQTQRIVVPGALLIGPILVVDKTVKYLSTQQNIQIIHRRITYTLLYIRWIHSFTYIHIICKVITHSIPSMNGVSLQSFSGNLCKIIPLLIPLPTNEYDT